MYETHGLQVVARVLVAFGVETFERGGGPFGTDPATRAILDGLLLHAKIQEISPQLGQN